MKGLQILVAIGGALFGLIILLAISADISGEVQADVACGSSYTYIENVTYPGGLCCLTAQSTNCTGNTQAFTTAGNTTSKGMEGLFNLSKQTPNMGTLVGVVAILSVILLVAAVVRRR